MLLLTVAALAPHADPQLRAVAVTAAGALTQLHATGATRDPDDLYIPTPDELAGEGNLMGQVEGTDLMGEGTDLMGQVEATFDHTPLPQQGVWEPRTLCDLCARALLLQDWRVADPTGSNVTLESLRPGRLGPGTPADDLDPASSPQNTEWRSWTQDYNVPAHAAFGPAIYPSTGDLLGIVDIHALLLQTKDEPGQEPAAGSGAGPGQLAPAYRSYGEQLVNELVASDPQACASPMRALGYAVSPPGPAPLRAGYAAKAWADSAKAEAAQGSPGSLAEAPRGLDLVVTAAPTHKKGRSCVDSYLDCAGRAERGWCAAEPGQAASMCCRACGFGLVPVQNEGFEADSLEGPQTQQQGWQYVRGSPSAPWRGACALSAWHAEGDVALSKNGNTAWGGLDSGAGSAFAVLQAGSIAQDLKQLTVGETYTVRLRAARKPGAEALEAVASEPWTGAPVAPKRPDVVLSLTLTDTAGTADVVLRKWQTSRLDDHFEDYAVTFTADRPAARLTVASSSPAAVFVDDIRVLEGGSLETEPVAPLDAPVAADHMVASEP